MRRSIALLLAAPTAGIQLNLPAFRVAEKGTTGEKDWRLFFHRDATTTTTATAADVCSPWHDLPLTPNKDGHPLIFTYVNEIPRGTTAKMEMIKEEAFNPIGQDLHKKEPGQPLRYFTYGKMPFNYGFIPRTWEDPDAIDADTKCRGDGDPIDAVQLGPSATATGAILPVRVLGVLALIDQGETDWKVVTEAVVLGKEGDGYGSIDRVPAGVQRDIVDWFRNYKTTDGKPQNDFAFDGRIRGAEAALAAIHECAGHYRRMVRPSAGEVSKHGYWLPAAAGGSASGH